MANVDEMLLAAKTATRALAAPALSAQPRRRLAVLTCMDARIDPPRMFGFESGDAHVLRNAGGLVTDDAIRSLSISQRLLGTDEIVVVMHDDCGLCGASDEQFAAALAADGAHPSWRSGAFDDIEQVLRDGLARLRESPELSARGLIRGLIFNPADGTLREPSAQGG